MISHLFPAAGGESSIQACPPSPGKDIEFLKSKKWENDPKGRVITCFHDYFKGKCLLPVFKAPAGAAGPLSLAVWLSLPCSGLQFLTLWKHASLQDSSAWVQHPKGALGTEVSVSP